MYEGRLELKRAWRLGGEERMHWKIGMGMWTYLNEVKRMHGNFMVKLTNLGS